MREIQTIRQRDVSLRAILAAIPISFAARWERLSLLDPLHEFIGAISESLPIIVQPNFITICP